MSSTLLIGSRGEGYDCVISQRDCAAQLDAFLEQWEPWKIRIGDLELFREIEPALREKFDESVGEYPDDIWSFYFGDQSIVHPTQEELDEWILAAIKPANQNE